MEGDILLKCLVKGSYSYKIVKELNSSGGSLDIYELEKRTGIERRIIDGFINNLWPAVLRGSPTITINPQYDFVITSREGISGMGARRRKYNEQVSNLNPSSENLSVVLRENEILYKHTCPKCLGTLEEVHEVGSRGNSSFYQCTKCEWHSKELPNLTKEEIKKKMRWANAI